MTKPTSHSSAGRSRPDLPTSIPPTVLAQATADVAANPPPPPNLDLAADVADTITIGPHTIRRLTAGDLWIIDKVQDKITEEEFPATLFYVLTRPTPEELIPTIINHFDQFKLDAITWSFQLTVDHMLEAMHLVKEYQTMTDLLGGEDDPDQENNESPK